MKKILIYEKAIPFSYWDLETIHSSIIMQVFRIERKFFKKQIIKYKYKITAPEIKNAYLDGHYMSRQKIKNAVKIIEAFAQSKISEIQNDGHYKLVKVEDE